MTIHIVIIGGGINGLGVVRSLDKTFDIHVIDSQSDCPAAYSRHAIFHRVNSTKSRLLIDDLVSLRKQFNRNPVLIITEEKAVYNVSKFRSEISSLFHFLMPEHRLVDQLLDKDEFYNLAVKHNAPVPRTLTISSYQDLVKADTLSFPCVFKPHEQNAAYSQHFKKAYKVFSAQEVTGLYQEIEPTLKTMILQEWIEGEDSDIFFTLSYISKIGKVLSNFTGRKIRSWPPNVGGTASCTNAPEAADELEQLSLDFCKKINYQGLIGIEYKRNKTDGKYIIIEPTVARTDFQHEISALSGCELLNALVLDLSDQPISKNQPQNKISRSIVWKESISEAMAIEKSGNSQYPSGATIYSALFRWSDPQPYLAQLIKRMKRKFLS